MKVIAGEKGGVVLAVMEKRVVVVGVVVRMVRMVRRVLVVVMWIGRSIET